MTEDAVDYQTHLAAIEEALKDDPENKELIQLKNDILEIIALDKESKAVEADSEPPVDHTEPVIEKEKPDLKKYLGRICTVVYQGNPVYSKIIAVKDEKLTLDLFGLSKQVVTTLPEIKLLQSLSQSQCKPGTRLQALYQPDGLWYDCIVDKITPLGYYIKYCDYDTTELVGFDQVRLPQNKGNRQNGVKEIITPAGYRIPENLLVKDTDTEKQRMKKRKIVSSLKKKQKQESIDKEIEDRVNSWRDFQKKVRPRV